MVRNVLIGICVMLMLLLLIVACSDERKSDSQPSESPKRTVGDAVPLADLAQWRFLGKGEMRIDETENALYMTESEGSSGVTLVSNKQYGTNVVVTFSVKPASFESVNVVIISASDKNTGGEITVPGDYDGGFTFWTQEDVQDYVFAFHNAAHERLPFIVKNPGMELLGEADRHVTSENWHDVEIGRNDARVWMKIDGAMIVEANDPSGGMGLPGGVIGFRLRGTPDSVASAWFRDVVITGS